MSRRLIPSAAGSTFLRLPQCFTLAALIVLPLGCGGDEPSKPVVVAVDPATASVRVGRPQQFTATVTGAENAAVVWSLDVDTMGGTISASGVYLAPIGVPSPATTTVRATSQADPTKSGTATVTVVRAGPEPSEFVHVRAGRFTMGDGSPSSGCGIETQDVTLTHDFYIGPTEVTNQQYLEMVQWAYDQGYVAAGGGVVYDRLDWRTAKEAPLLYMAAVGSEITFSDGVFSLRDAGHGINPDHPVKEVTWYGAVAYCDWLSLEEGLWRAYDHTTWICNSGDPYSARGFRLPTEAEWEYVAQYDDERIYPWGNESPSCDRANYSSCNTGWTAPVGTQAAGPEKVIGGKGLYDMAGNVWEWCNDWHDCLGTAPMENPPGPSAGTFHVFRGGSWGSDVQYLPRAYRYQFGNPRFRNANTGFRVARTVNP